MNGSTDAQPVVVKNESSFFQAPSSDRNPSQFSYAKLLFAGSEASLERGVEYESDSIEVNISGNFCVYISVFKIPIANRVIGVLPGCLELCDKRQPIGFCELEAEKWSELAADEIRSPTAVFHFRLVFSSNSLLCLDQNARQIQEAWSPGHLVPEEQNLIPDKTVLIFSDIVLPSPILAVFCPAEILIEYCLVRSKDEV